MTEDLAQQFIDHSLLGFASDMLAELGLDHPHGRLDIRALVIVSQEFLTMILVHTPQLLPQRRAIPIPCCILLEGDVRRSAERSDQFQVRLV